MARLNMVDAIDQALLQAMERDPKIVVLGEDVGRDGGVFRVTDGLMQRFGEERVIDTPLAESGIVGMAIGMAIAGYHPVAEIQFSGFAYPAYDQLVSHAARMRNRSRGEFTVPLVVRMPYGGGIRALEHHSESMEAIFAHVPGLKVVIPADPYEAKGLLTAALRDPDPVVFFEPARVYRAIKTEVPEEPYVLPLGKARVVREGRDVTLIAWGAQVRTVKEAAQQLEAEGVADAEVIDVRTLSPFDFETVIASVSKTGRAVIVHEAPRTCGFGAEISAEIMERAVLHLQAPGPEGRRVRHGPAAGQAGGLLSAGCGHGGGRGQVAHAVLTRGRRQGRRQARAKEWTWNTRSSWNSSKAGARYGPSSRTPYRTSWSTSSWRRPAGLQPGSTCSRWRCWW